MGTILLSAEWSPGKNREVGREDAKCPALKGNWQHHWGEDGRETLPAAWALTLQGWAAKKMVIWKSGLINVEDSFVFFLILLKNIEKLFLEIKEVKNEIYSRSWPFPWYCVYWFAGQLDLSEVFWKPNPEWGDSGAWAWKTEENHNFHSSSSPPGLRHLLCSVYLLRRVWGLSEKTYAKVPDGVCNP